MSIIARAEPPARRPRWVALVPIWIWLLACSSLCSAESSMTMLVPAASSALSAKRAAIAPPATTRALAMIPPATRTSPPASTSAPSIKPPTITSPVARIFMSGITSPSTCTVPSKLMLPLARLTLRTRSTCSTETPSGRQTGCPLNTARSRLASSGAT